MKKLTNKGVLCLLMVLILCAAAVLPASANSAQSYWEGVDASGVLTTDGECPIVVEHETLTFDINAFPETYYNSAEEYFAYDASVTAEYTFCNPSDMTVTAKLLFPFGINPYYADSFYDPETGEYVPLDNSEKYGAQVNGQAVQTTVRYSYWGGSLYNFDPALEMAKLHDGYVQSGFLVPDLPVHVYTYVISGVDDRTYRAASAAADFDYDPARTMIMLDDSNGGQISDGHARMSIFVDDYDQIVLYVFGEDIGEVDWKFYENGALETEIAGQVEAISRETVTFGELAMQAYDQSVGILAHDWYNAVVQKVEEGRWDDTCVYRDIARGWDVSDDLLAWYEYEITLAPGGRLTNTVTAPLYPHIDDSYDPRVYTYSYLLSPASLWADFGTLDVYINTPYYLVDEGEASVDPDTWGKTDTGYRLHLDSLPDQDLVFVLSESEDPAREANAWTALLIFLMGMAMLASVGVVLALAVLILLAVIGRKVLVAVIVATVLLVSGKRGQKPKV